MAFHADVLRLLDCDDLYSLVPDEFLATHGLNRPEQYGMVCADVPAAQAELEALGCAPFVYAQTKGPNWCERGERRDVKLELALGYSNGQQIELLGPGENTQFYSDKIPADGRVTLHHVCVIQKGIDRLEASLNAAGFQTVLTGHVGLEGLYTTKFRYLDTREELGFYLELTEYKTLGMHMPPGEKTIGFLGRMQRRFAA